VVFRDSSDLEWGPFNEVLTGTTQRVLNLATDYAAAISETIEGEKPEDAVKRVVDAQSSGDRD
jgi:hypothetical protein